MTETWTIAINGDEPIMSTYLDLRREVSLYEGSVFTLSFEVPDTLTILPPTGESVALEIHRDGEPYMHGGGTLVDASRRRMVSGEPARVRLEVDGRLQL